MGEELQPLPMVQLADAKPWTPAEARAEKRGQVLHMELAGDWVTAQAATLDRTLDQVDFGGADAVEIDGSKIGRLDSVGAWLLLKLRREGETSGRKITQFAVPENFSALMDVIHREHKRAAVKFPRPRGFLGFLDRLGRDFLHVVETAYTMLGYLGLVSIELVQTVVRKRRLRLIPVLRQMEDTGFTALPILGMLAALLGVVIAYQGVDQLRKFGAEIFTVNLLGVSILREIGVLITAIIVAGRSGSAFTAHIGTMKINQEIDAMQTSGINVPETLVLPRIVALTLVMPLLTFFADVVGIIGGAIMCYLALGIRLPTFINQLHDAITATTFWVGMVKAPVFGFLIALVGCFEGLRVEGNAASLGQQTTRAVVEAIFLVIVVDGAFSIIFSILEI